MAAQSREEQARVVERAKAVTAELTAWSAGIPCILEVRVWPLALAMAAGVPALDVQALAAVGRLNLWVFALDDLFDDGSLAILAMRRRAARYCALACGRALGEGASDPLARLLVDVRECLARYTLFDVLRCQWERALCGTIRAMVTEDRWRRWYAAGDVTRLPSLPGYLDVGRWSVGGPPFNWAAVIAAGDPSSERNVPRLWQLDRLASSSIRLANDLQSREKERLEGSVNAVSLLALRDAGPQDERDRRAVARVDDMLQDLVEEMDRVLRAVPGTDTGAAEAAIAGMARMTVDYYRNHDFHQAVPGMPDPATTNGDR
jgi:hypothetical protein